MDKQIAERVSELLAEIKIREKIISTYEKEGQKCFSLLRLGTDKLDLPLSLNDKIMEAVNAELRFLKDELKAI